MKLYILGLLDYEKAFDFTNRAVMLKNMMEMNIGKKFLKNLANTYENTSYVPKITKSTIGEEISTNHGVTQGRTSSCNLFCYFISDMPQCLVEFKYNEMDPSNLLQLMDDTVVTAESKDILSLKMEKLINYSEQKYLEINTDKTKYMQLVNVPSMEDIVMDNHIMKAVKPEDGYVWLGFILSYTNNVQKLIETNLNKKKFSLCRFYSWLEINETTPIKLKLNVLYSCMFASILYSCETWGNIDNIINELLAIERKALKSCLGVKQGTPNDVIYIELNKPDIEATIMERQFNFFDNFKKLNESNAEAKKLWNKFVRVLRERNKSCPFVEYYCGLNKGYIKKNMSERKIRIAMSEKSMDKRYNEMFNLNYSSVLYNSLVNDTDRCIITRWRLSCHQLYIETGRYKNPKIERAERKCSTCLVLENEFHALFQCCAHVFVRNKFDSLLLKYKSVQELLNPSDHHDIREIAAYIRTIEKNMEVLNMYQ